MHLSSCAVEQGNFEKCGDFYVSPINLFTWDQFSPLYVQSQPLLVGIRVTDLEKIAFGGISWTMSRIQQPKEKVQYAAA